MLPPVPCEKDKDEERGGNGKSARKVAPTPIQHRSEPLMDSEHDRHEHQHGDDLQNPDHLPKVGENP